MDIRFSNDNGFFCTFADSELLWHDFRHNIFLSLPYRSIKKITYRFGILSVKCQSKKYKVFFRKKNNDLKETIVFIRNIIKISSPYITDKTDKSE